MSTSEAATRITVKYTCACDKCGTVNVEEDRPMDLDTFNAESRSSPATHWREDQSGKTVYRHHEESREGRCNRSC